MKGRLAILYFLQFSVWGCYLSCFGQMLGAGGLGKEIAWFYAAIGLVSILTPSIFGRISDKTGRPVTILALCHLLASAAMFVMWRYGSVHPKLEFQVFYPLYLLFLAFYMPTMALSNTASFGIISAEGKNPATTFPAVRIWGTIGFVAAMWFVNSAYFHDGSFGFAFSDNDVAGQSRFQYNSMQLLCSAVAGFLTAIYALTLPNCDSKKTSEIESFDSSKSLLTSLQKIFLDRSMAVFLVFAILSGVCMQISNGFVTPFISHFSAIPEYMNSVVSGNATLLFSLSQISEAASVLLVGLYLKRRGIKWVYTIGLLAWTIRFLFLAVGNPGDGLPFLIGSMVVFGIAFNFITIAGSIYIQQVSPENMKGFSQGLLMFMSNGIGATFGTLIAGSVVNRWCEWKMIELPGESSMRFFMGEWIYPWLIFAGYAFVIFLLWIIIFKRDKTPSQSSHLSQSSKKSHD